MNKIPRQIHVTCRDKQQLVAYKVFLNSITQYNAGWEIHLYDDRDIEDFIQEHFPFLFEIYQAFPAAIQRMDLFRLLVVFVYGGFYMDADMYCLKSLEELCVFQLVLAEEKTLMMEECQALHHEHSLRIANYMFGSEPAHPFWLEAAGAVIANINEPVLKEADVLETTGPGLLTKAYHSLKDKYPEIELVRNETNLCLKECSNVASCHFGDYAAHLHLGSWRWEYYTGYNAHIKGRPALQKAIEPEKLAAAMLVLYRLHNATGNRLLNGSTLST